MNMAGKPGVKKEFFVYQLVLYIRYFDILTWLVTSLFFFGTLAWSIATFFCLIYTLYRMLFFF